MKPSSPAVKTLPLKMVGGSNFGRYPKISPEMTWNMLISDNWMVPFPGYAITKVIDNTGEGRAIYSSEKAGLIFAVIDNTFYSIDQNLNLEIRGTLQTSSGDVFIAENNASQIAICDKTYLYIFNYGTGDFFQVPFPTTYAPMATVSYTAESSQATPTIVGTKFTIGASDIVVTTLGAYQNLSVNIFTSGSANVGIFDAGGNLVVSATVYPTADPSLSASYVSINPTTLSAGATYTIIQTVATSAYVLSNGTLTFPADITYVATVSAASSVLAFTAANTYAYTRAMGPLFQYATSANTLKALYVTFQDTYFIVPASDGQWYLSYNNNGTIFPIDAQHIGEFQTKPDLPVAAIRLPGKGNKLLIFGKNVTESWSDLGLQLFPYQRDTFNNIDYGCLNPASIAALEDYVVWLAGNEQSGPTIMYSDGQKVERISTDGIGFKLANLTAPQECYGFLFRQYDHIVYVLTFTNPADNYSLCYDFTTKKFSNLCDPNMDAFIAKRITFFSNTYYFVSIIDGNLYVIDSSISTYGGQIDHNQQDLVINGYSEIPMIRIPPTFRLPDASRFVASNVNFPIDQGVGTVAIYPDAPGPPVVDLSISKDGGYTFGASYRKNLNTLAVRPNRLNFWNLGAANEITCQFRFHGVKRAVFTDGELNVYQ